MSCQSSSQSKEYKAYIACHMASQSKSAITQVPYNETEIMLLEAIFALHTIKNHIG